MITGTLSTFFIRQNIATCIVKVKSQIKLAELIASLLHSFDREVSVVHSIFFRNIP